MFHFKQLEALIQREWMQQEGKTLGVIVMLMNEWQIGSVTHNPTGIQQPGLVQNAITRLLFLQSQSSVTEPHNQPDFLNMIINGEILLGYLARIVWGLWSGHSSAAQRGKPAHRPVSADRTSSGSCLQIYRAAAMSQSACSFFSLSACIFICPAQTLAVVKVLLQDTATSCTEFLLMPRPLRQCGLHWV